ncbi:MAG: HipA family kinase [Saprospiraceae bacterium]
MIEGEIFRIEDFMLDQMMPVQHHKELGSSSNKPMLTTCFNIGNSVKKDIVVKLMASERMSADACMKECVASLMALALNIETPRPVSVLIQDLFIQSRKGYEDIKRYEPSKGINFGTEFIYGLEEIYPLYQLENHLRSEALKIFAFDLLIQNIDRTLPPGKPNLFTDHHHLYILDHELAFAFLDLIIPSKEKPWQFGEESLFWVRSHILYIILRHKQLDYSALKGMLTAFTPQYWHEIRRILPKEWQNKARLQQIERHVTEVRDHEDEFIHSIQNILK